MKTNTVKLLVTGLLMVSSLVGCGAETIGAIAVGAKLGAAGAGGIYILKQIENLSLDNQKKALEIRAIQNDMQGVRSR